MPQNNETEKLKKITYKEPKERITFKPRKGDAIFDQIISGLTVEPLIENKKKILASVEQTPYFVKDNFVLYNGDSLTLLKSLPENSIDMIFADPPYNLSNGGFSVHAGRQVSVNKGEWDLSNGLKKNFEFHL